MSEGPRTPLAQARELLRGSIGKGLSVLRGRDKPDHPLDDERQLERIITNLSDVNPWQTLEDVNHWLASLNGAPGYTAEHRYRVISRLDVATRQCQGQLLEKFYALHGENFVEEKRIWNTLTTFWTALSDGYLACARLCGDAGISRGMQTELPVLAVRGLRALRYQIKCLLLRYGLVDAEIWTACGVFVALAESVTSADARVEMYEGSGISSTPNAEFLRLVMFWTLAPSGLSPIEQDIAERLVLHLTDKFRLSTFQEDSFDYFFDLVGTHPPLRLVRSSPWSPQTRYFAVSAAQQAVRVMHAMASSTGMMPVGIDLGVNAEANVVARVLAHVALNWAKELPARATERRKFDMALNVVQGYQAVLGVVAPASAEGVATQNALLQESWVTNDVSAGGYGVIVPAGAGELLHVGNMIAVRPSPDIPWHLGIIRRVQAYKLNQRHIGIQLITKAAAPIEVRSLSGVARGSKRVWAIMLDEWPLADGTIDILVRRDLLNGREAVEATYGTDKATVILAPGGVVESGQDFDWLRYKLPERFPDLATQTPVA